MRLHMKKRSLIYIVAILVVTPIAAPKIVFAGWSCSTVHYRSATSGFFNEPIVNYLALGTWILIFVYPLLLLCIYLLRLLLQIIRNTLFKSFLIINALILLSIPTIFLSLLSAASLVLMATQLANPTTRVNDDTSGSLLSTCTVWTFHTPIYIRVLCVFIIAGIVVLFVRFLRLQRQRLKASHQKYYESTITIDDTGGVKDLDTYNTDEQRKDT